MIINIGKEHLRTVRYFTNDSSSYCYVPILKNAHSFGMHYFQKFVNYAEVNKLPQNKQFIIFLRDPIERWLSAVAEYFHWHVDLNGNLTGQRVVDTNLFTDKKRKPYLIPDEIMNMIFNAVRLDTHSDLQIRFLLGLNTDRCVFFDLRDPNFINNLNLFMWRRLKVKEPYVYFIDNEVPISVLNSSENNQFKLSIIKQVKDVMKSNSQYYSNVLNYHQPDIYFMKNIKFHS